MAEKREGPVCVYLKSCLFFKNRHHMAMLKSKGRKRTFSFGSSTQPRLLLSPFPDAWAALSQDNRRQKSTFFPPLKIGKCDCTIEPQMLTTDCRREAERSENAGFQIRLLDPEQTYERWLWWTLCAAWKMQGMHLKVNGLVQRFSKQVGHPTDDKATSILLRPELKQRDSHFQHVADCS